jgi:hypothetical protein
MSDPMSTGLNLPQGITSDLQYTNKAIAPKGRVYESIVNPSNASTFKPSTMAIIDLPTARSGSYLDGKSLALRFTVTFTVTGTDTSSYVSICDMANSFVESVNLYAGGQLIESISNYADIANLMMNLALSPSQKAALGSVIGADPNGSVYGHTIDISNAPTTAYKRTFVIPLMSFLSSTKMIDLSEILSGFRLEITWASAVNSIYAWKTAIGTATARVPTWELSDVGLIHSIVELDQSGVAMVNAMKSPEGTLYFGRSFRNTSANIPNASGDIVLAGNNRLSSIVAAYARFRPAFSENATTKLYLVNGRSSANPDANYYQWRFGSVSFPQRQVNLENNDGGYAHAYRNLLQSVNSWATPASGCALGFLPPATVTTGVPTVASATSYYNTKVGGANTDTGVLDDGLGFGTFAIGQDLELFANRGDVLLSGVSTLASPFYLQMNIASTINKSLTCDIWAHHDLIMVVRNGQVQVIV